MLSLWLCLNCQGRLEKKKNHNWADEHHSKHLVADSRWDLNTVQQLNYAHLDLLQ